VLAGKRITFWTGAGYFSEKARDLYNEIQIEIVY
jgi:hypothetical protein